MVAEIVREAVNRQPPHPVQRRDQRLEASLVDELDLVEQKDHARPRVSRGLAELDEQVAEVLFEVAGVGHAG